MHRPESNHQQPKSLLTVKRRGLRRTTKFYITFVLRLQWDEVQLQHLLSAPTVGGGSKVKGIWSASSPTSPTSISSSAPTVEGGSIASFSSGTESSTSASHLRVGATAYLRRIIGSSRGTRYSIAGSCCDEPASTTSTSAGSK